METHLPSLVKSAAVDSEAEVSRATPVSLFAWYELVYSNQADKYEMKGLIETFVQGCDCLQVYITSVVGGLTSKSQVASGATNQLIDCVIPHGVVDDNFRASSRSASLWAPLPSSSLVPTFPLVEPVIRKSYTTLVVCARGRSPLLTPENPPRGSFTPE